MDGDLNGLLWRSSSRSSGGSCVEIEHQPLHVLLRHSGDPGGVVLAFGQMTFQALIQVVRSGAGPVDRTLALTGLAAPFGLGASPEPLILHEVTSSAGEPTLSCGSGVREAGCVEGGA